MGKKNSNEQPLHQLYHMLTVRFISDIWLEFMYQRTSMCATCAWKKEMVLFIGGSDEHGVPITIRAKKRRSHSARYRRPLPHTDSRLIQRVRNFV